MSGPETPVIPGFDPASGMFSMPWWAASVLAALLVIFFVLAVVRSGLIGVLASVVGTVVLAMAVWAVWVWVDRAVDRDRMQERFALQTRLLELTTRAAAPGSMLACLDATSGEAVEAACEKTVFASPESVSAATSYIAARMALLSDGVDYAMRVNTSYEAALPGLRRGLEADRFGLVAQVLATTYGCTPDNCDALTMFRDASHIRANLKDRAFDAFVDRNSAGWPVRPVRAASSAPPAPAPASDVAASNGTGPSPVPPGFDVPSSASIPPVSIMAPEPPAPAATPQRAEPTPPPAPPRRRATRPSSQHSAQQRAAPAASAPPISLAPPGATAGNPPRAQ